MTFAALCLVLLAALTHASWNIYAKYAAECRHFVWLFSAGSVLVYGPIVLAVVLVEQPVFESHHWLALAATSGLHLLYSLSLQTGYRHSEYLTVVFKREIAEEARCIPELNLDEHSILEEITARLVRG